MLVDSHMHVSFRGFSPERIVRYLDRNGIECCWLLTWEESHPGGWPYQHLSIEEVFDAYSKYPSRIIPMYAPDPRRSDAAAALESWYRRGVRGCGELKAAVDWASPQVRSLLTSAGNLGIPVVFHMEEGRRMTIPRSSAIHDRLLCAGLHSKRMRYAIVRGCLRAATRVSTLGDRLEEIEFPGYMVGFASLEKALVDFPTVNFVAHGPMFWEHMSAVGSAGGTTSNRSVSGGDGIVWRLLRDHPNLYADLSGMGFAVLRRSPEDAGRFLSVYEDKILYGTDNFMERQMQFLDSLQLGRGTLRKILGGNALGLVSAITVESGVSTLRDAVHARADQE